MYVYLFRLMKSKSIIKQAGANSEILWSRLAKLMTVLSLQNPEYEQHASVEESFKKCSKIMDFLAFSEDFRLKGITEYEAEFKTTKWNIIYDLDDQDWVNFLHIILISCYINE